MTLKSTKTHLIQLLDDTDNSVIALSGKWGTGKSYLWREVKAESKDEKVNSALYVSLFGLSSMDQIKYKIVQSAIPSIGEHPSWWENARKGWSAASKILESVHKGFSALNEIALLAVPSILKDKVIVLDDIERKHDKLSVDEVMGFIDEFTQQHNARIILILNSDQLADRSIWDKLREKVIDQEVMLNTSPEEAFEIAVRIVPSAYASPIKDTLETCGITNIRIICKVIRSVNRILGNREDLSGDVLGRVIPSTVLLSAIHYKGIEDGPDFEFVLKVGNPEASKVWEKKDEELDEDGKRRAKWRLQLHELDINACDEYEQLVVDFLKSGMFDVADVAKIIERYSSEADMMKARSQASLLREHIIFHHKLTEPELIAEAQVLAKKSHLLDAYAVTSLSELVSELAGGGAIADTMINNWIEIFRARDNQNFEFENFFNHPIHPCIQDEFDKVTADLESTTTIYDACKHIGQHGGWGSKQERVMKSASVQEFEATIMSLDGDDLRYFMIRFLGFCSQRTSHLSHFGSAMDHFVEACRKICANPNSGRLSVLIKLLFKDAKLESELNPSPSIVSVPLAASTSIVV